MKPINQAEIKSDSVKDLINELKDTGFNGKKLAKACLIYEEMIKNPKCTKFFGLAGAMVPAGMQNIIKNWISKGYINVLVTTGANLTHDVAEALGYRHEQGESDVSDEKLHNKGVDRIYDVFMNNKVYEAMEKFIQELELPPKLSVKELLWLIGEKLNDENSILTTAAKLKVPIYCPAFADCGLGVQFAINHDKIMLDHMKDLRELINLAWDSDPAGIIMVGGGVPKNHIMQALQFTPNNASYAIQITTDIPSPGGLSGAELREGISWGKINPKAKFVSVLCDATIALPVIAAYLS